MKKGGDWPDLAPFVRGRGLFLLRPPVCLLSTYDVCLLVLRSRSSSVASRRQFAAFTCIHAPIYMYACMDTWPERMDEEGAVCIIQKIFLTCVLFSAPKLLYTFVRSYTTMRVQCRQWMKGKCGRCGGVPPPHSWLAICFPPDWTSRFFSLLLLLFLATTVVEWKGSNDRCCI